MSKNLQPVPVGDELREFFSDLWDKIFEDRNEVLNSGDDTIQYDYGMNGFLSGGYSKSKGCFNFRFDPDRADCYWRFTVTENELSEIVNRGKEEIAAEVFIKEVVKDSDPKVSKPIVRRKGK